MKIKPRMRLLVASILFIGPGAFFVSTAMAAHPPEDAAQKGFFSAALPSFADVVERVSPAVVNISISKKAEPIPTSGPPELPRGFGGSPFEEFFGRQFEGPGNPAQLGPSQALGSGFVLDGDGYIVTNHHVVEGAESITITFEGGRQIAATLVGEDPKTDLALLKVETNEPLPHATLGEADEARVGDWVLAIGNPFGLGGTATVGIVSAKGRDINSGPYDDYLQIDAPINSGNSGGPIFNANGEVIGVNTAIYSPNGGNVGIGFAIPVRQVASIVAELKQHGQVTRGWLGVQIQPLDEELAKSVRLDDTEGALVSDVTSGSPAQEAGLRIGDVVLGFDGHDVESPKALGRIVAEADPDETVDVDIWRDGHSKTVRVRLGQSDAEAASVASTRSKQESVFDDLGMSVTPLTDVLRSQLGLSDEDEGMIVIDVQQESVAAGKGLRRGDLIRSVDGKTVTSPENMASALKDARSQNGTALLLIKRGEGQRLVAVALA